MKWCPKCDTRLLVKKVAGSPYDKELGRYPTMYRMNEVVVGWYSQDWTARERRCPKCGYKVWTTEIPIEDFVAILKEAGEGKFEEALKS